AAARAAAASTLTPPMQGAGSPGAVRLTRAGTDAAQRQRHPAPGSLARGWSLPGRRLTGWRCGPASPSGQGLGLRACGSGLAAESGRVQVAHRAVDEGVMVRPPVVGAHQTRLYQLQPVEVADLLGVGAEPPGRHPGILERPLQEPRPRVAVVEEVRHQQVATGGQAAAQTGGYALRVLLVGEVVQDRGGQDRERLAGVDVAEGERVVE